MKGVGTSNLDVASAKTLKEGKIRNRKGYGKEDGE